METLDWPFDWERVDGSLQPDLIEQQGSFFLKRALNIMNLVAFTGVGASMGYGRISWGELGLSQLLGIEAAFPGPLPEDPTIVKRLAAQLVALKEDMEKEKGDVVVLGMQLAERIWSLATDDELRSLRQSFGIVGRENATGEMLFRYLIKQQTYDETAYICRILQNPFAKPYAGQHNKKLGKILSTLELKRFPNSSGGGDAAEVFSRSELVAILEDIKKNIGQDMSTAAHTFTSLSRFIDTYIETFSRYQYVPPIHYFVLGLILDALRFHKHHIGAFEKRIQALLERPSTKERTRSHLIPRRNDPYWILVEQLNITRFATTNYDLEIERLMGDLGFKETLYDFQNGLQSQDNHRVGPMGARAREIVLTEKTSADLIDFCSPSGPFSIQVAHLHGRATDESTEDRGTTVIVTERDYQEKYIGNSPGKITARQGLKVLFGGNPVLFVGLGLSEADVMRPFREFVGKQSRRNRSIFALMPADRDLIARNNFVLEHYIRHGIYILHYGFTETGDSKKSWLQLFSKYAVALDEFLKLYEEKAKSAEEFEARRRALITQIGKNENALKRVVGNANFFSDGDECNISFELKALDFIKSFVEMLSYEVAGNLRTKALVTVLKKNTTRTRNAVMTKALSAYLLGLEKDWNNWRGEWWKLPTPRSVV